MYIEVYNFSKEIILKSVHSILVFFYQKKEEKKAELNVV